MILLPNNQQQNNSDYRYLPPQTILPEPHYPGLVQLNGIDNMKLSGQPTYPALEGTQRTRTNPGDQNYRAQEGTQRTPIYPVEQNYRAQEVTRITPGYPGEQTYCTEGGTQRIPVYPGEQNYRGKEETQMTPAGYSLEEISSTQERAQPFINQGGIQGFPVPHYDLYSNGYPIESPPGIVILKIYDKNSFIKFSICYVTINPPV